MSRISLKILYAFLVIGGLAVVGVGWMHREELLVLTRMNVKKTVDDRVREFGEIVHRRLAKKWANLGIPYPPEKIVLLGLKEEKQLEVWVAGKDGALKHLTTYPILAASGALGPKLREGDRQVPEGIYRIEALNPNSLFHLSLRVNYPNDFDRARASEEGRSNLGSDIMIHGKSVSVGCLALGDEVAEDLFVLAAEAGIDRIDLILSPVDFRKRDLPAGVPRGAPWIPELYAEIRRALLDLSASSRN